MVNSLRVLLVESDPSECDRIASRLGEASHEVLPTTGLDEAVQALQIQQFDAVVLDSRFVDNRLAPFRESLNRFEKDRKAPSHIPLLCYVPSAFECPTSAEMSRFQIDACLPQDFDALVFSHMVAGLASEVASLSAMSSSAMSGKDQEQLLPAFNSQEFREQIGFDSELTVEIIDLFLSESEKQLTEMRNAFLSGDFLTLSRTAHSLKGSLGSLYAAQATSRAQTLEQVAKLGDREQSGRALSGLEADLEALKPELVQLRKAESGS